MSANNRAYDSGSGTAAVVYAKLPRGSKVRMVGLVGTTGAFESKNLLLAIRGICEIG